MAKIEDEVRDQQMQEKQQAIKKKKDIENAEAQAKRRKEEDVDDEKMVRKTASKYFSAPCIHLANPAIIFKKNIKSQNQAKPTFLTNCS